MNAFAPYFSGVVALVIVLFGEQLKRLLAGATIELADPVPVRTKVKEPTAGIDSLTPAYLFLLRVKAKRITLRRCRVNLIALRKRKGQGPFEPIRMLVPHQFSWSPRYVHDQGDAINVNAGTARVVDFVRLLTPLLMDGPKRRIMPMLYQFPPYFEGWVYPGETMRYTIQIEADGYTSPPSVFEVRWDGEYAEDNPEAMVDHIEIRKL